MRRFGLGLGAAALWALGGTAAADPAELEPIGWHTVRQSNMAPLYRLDDTIRLSAVLERPSEAERRASATPFAYLGRPPRFWVAERRRVVWRGGRIEDPRGPGAAARPVDAGTTEVRRQWIDGRTCPALEGRLRALAQLSFQAPAPDRLEFGMPPSSHFPTVTLSSRTRYGDLRAHDFGIGPLTDWWSGMERALAPCWRDTPVMEQGRPLVDEPSSDEAAAAAMR